MNNDQKKKELAATRGLGLLNSLKAYVAISDDIDRNIAARKIDVGDPNAEAALAGARGHIVENLMHHHGKKIYGAGAWRGGAAGGSLGYLIANKLTKRRNDEDDEAFEKRHMKNNLIGGAIGTVGGGLGAAGGFYLGRKLSNNNMIKAIEYLRGNKT